LAERVASGEMDVESWLTSELPTDKLKREMKRVKGIGDYAAENLLKLVGRYDASVSIRGCAQFARKHNKGRAASMKRSGGIMRASARARPCLVVHLTQTGSTKPATPSGE